MGEDVGDDQVLDRGWICSEDVLCGIQVVLQETEDPLHETGGRALEGIRHALRNMQSSNRNESCSFMLAKPHAIPTGFSVLPPHDERENDGEGEGGTR